MAKGLKRKKKTPQRTCVACRKVQGKRDLVRIVRTPTEGVQVDPTSKLAGRGAYLCRSRECWELALDQRRLDSALKTKLSAEEKARLAEYARTLPQAVGLTSGEQRGKERDSGPSG
jgi:predicted RNA-binding protein YlxR (DUF448 family)